MSQDPNATETGMPIPPAPEESSSSQAETFSTFSLPTAEPAPSYTPPSSPSSFSVPPSIPPVEPPKKTNPWVIALVVILIVLCCCCVLAAGAGYWLWNNGDQLFGISQLFTSLA
jgi:hypothetical protein